MTASRGYYFALVGASLSFVLEALGLKRILDAQGPGGIRGVGFLFGGAITGIVSIGALHYYRQRKNEVKDQQQIAVETLANLAKNQQQKK